MNGQGSKFFYISCLGSCFLTFCLHPNPNVCCSPESNSLHRNLFEQNCKRKKKVKSILFPSLVQFPDQKKKKIGNLHLLGFFKLLINGKIVIKIQTNFCFGQTASLSCAGLPKPAFLSLLALLCPPLPALPEAPPTLELVIGRSLAASAS